MSKDEGNFYVAFNCKFESALKAALTNSQFEKYRLLAKLDMDRLIGGTKIDATMMQEQWFPDVKADIFISHSHKDAEKAKALADWIKAEFNLDCFIDSCVWGYCDDLLRELNNKYNYNERAKMYGYNNGNILASNIYMMLATSIMSVMDKCECAMFLNTDNSIPEPKDLFNRTDKTYSTWINYELLTAELIRKRAPLRQSVIDSLKGGNEKLPIFTYDVDLNYMIPLNDNDLILWKKEYSKHTNINPLDILYSIKGIASKE